MDGNYASIATNITKLIIVRSGEDLAAEAAHESYTRSIMEIMAVRTRRGGDRIGSSGVEL